MKRFTHVTMAMVAVTFYSQAWMGTVAPALATTVTDTFPLKLTGKEWCRNDPKFVEPIHVKILDGNTLTLTRDVLNTGDLTDIQASINTHGDNATIDAITMNGEALLANKSGSTAQLVLSGTDPGNSAHYLILRGKATFDKTGKLTKVTGTFVFQILDTVNGVPNIDCFGSGTFGAQKPPPPPPSNTQVIWNNGVVGSWNNDPILGGIQLSTTSGFSFQTVNVIDTVTGGSPSLTFTGSFLQAFIVNAQEVTPFANGHLQFDIRLGNPISGTIAVNIAQECFFAAGCFGPTVQLNGVGLSTSQFTHVSIPLSQLFTQVGGCGGCGGPNSRVLRPLFLDVSQSQGNPLPILNNVVWTTN